MTGRWSRMAADLRGGVASADSPARARGGDPVQGDKQTIFAPIVRGGPYADGAGDGALPPPADLVERLARALAAPRPWQRMTAPGGLSYFEARARQMLDRLDPLARGLLVQAEEAHATRWAEPAGAVTQGGG